ncbi:MAG: hypothetical protein RL670_226 [Actinomycetota bacterium]|jgi:hypothetical protein
MVIQINPFQPHFWRSVTQLQVGWGSSKVVLNDIDSPTERLIASLTLGIPDNQLETLMRQLKLTDVDAKQLLESLAPLLLTADMAQPSELELRDGELVRTTLVNQSDGYAKLADRASRRVWINHLNAAGAAIATGLAQARFTKLSTPDSAAVDQADSGTFWSVVQGVPRVSALNYQLRQSNIPAEVTLASLETAELAIFVEQLCLLPSQYAPLMNRGVPHLAVVFDPEGVTISPLIVPGKTACLYCLELHRIAIDPDWPVIASQLVSNQTNFDDIAARAIAAAKTISVLTAWVDRGLVSNGLRWDAATGAIEIVTATPHPDCDCLLQRRLEQGEKPRALAS